MNATIAERPTTETGTTWVVDAIHSKVKFSVSHLVIAEVDGNFKVYSGSVRSSSPDFTDGAIEFEVDVKSINTENEMRDAHLVSEDFFNAAQYPRMTFRSSSWDVIGEGKSLVTGDLTIRGVTRQVTFTVLYGGIMVDPYGNTKAGFKASAVINRFDYGLKWNVLTEAGGATVGKDVTITLNLELQPENVS